MKHAKQISKLFILPLLVLTVLVATPAKAEEDHEVIFEQAKILIEQETPCVDLTEDQLETLGEYYMEQMHPGEAHELMDMVMGGEGSNTLRQAHIRMGNAFYCKDGIGFGGGMMGVIGGGMMNGGVNSFLGASMMGNSNVRSGFGMMGENGYMNGFGVTNILVWIFLLLGIGAFIKYIIKK